MQEPTKKKKRARRTTSERLYRFLVKWPKRILIAVVLLLLIIVTLLQLPSVQNYIKDKTITKLQTELQTKISISDFKFSLFNGFYLNDLYIEDLQKDTLFFASKVLVSLDKGAYSLLKNKLSIKDVKIKNANLFLKRPTDSLHYNAQFILDYFKSDSPKDKKKISLALKTIQLDQVRVRKQDDYNKNNFDAFLYEGRIIVDSLDLNKNTFAINSVTLKYPSFSLYQHKTVHPAILDTMQTPKTKALLLVIQQLNINSGRFSLDRFDKSISRDSSKNIVDFDHLDVTKINVDLFDFGLVNNTFHTQLNNLSLREQSGFVLERLAAKNALVSNHEISLTEFTLNTPKNPKTAGTHLTNSVALKYKNFDAFKNFKNDVFIKAKLVDSRVAIRDILFFAKKLNTNKFFKLHKDKVVQISGDFFGKTNSPKANNLAISIGQTSLRGQFRVSNISDKEHASVNLDIQQLKTSVSTLRMLIPTLKLPQNFNTLGKLQFHGKFEGFLNDFVAFGELKTDLGIINGDMNLDITNGAESAKYSGTVAVDNFDLGKWFGNTKIGAISLTSSIKDGGGIRLHNAHAILKGELQKFVYKGYTYAGILMDGKLEKNFFDGQLISHTKDLDFDFNGSVDFTDTVAKYNFASQIKTLDLFALNLSKKPLKIAGDFDLNLAGIKLDQMTGKAIIKNVRLQDKSDLYQLDSATISAKMDDPSHRYLDITSNLINAKMEGVFDIVSIPNAFKVELIKKSPAFARKLHLTAHTDTTIQQNFSFDIQIPNTQNITKLLNIQIDTITDVTLSGHFNNITERFNINASIGGLFAGERAINSAIIDVSSKPNKLNLNAYIFETQLTSKKTLPPVSLKFALYPDTLSFRIKSSNISNVLKNIRFNGILLPTDDFYELHFNPSNIQVAQDDWKIKSQNYLRFSKDYLEAKNINFVSQNRRLELTTPTHNSLQLDLQNFDLAFINSLQNYENLKYAGPFTARVQMNDIKNKKDLRLRIDADTLLVSGNSYGKLKIRAKMADFKTPLNVQVGIGKNRLLNIGGYIHFADQVSSWKGRSVPPKSILLQGGIHDFPFKIMEDIIPKGISHVDGLFDGNIKIEGPLKGPEFKGFANIKTGEITIDYLKTHYYITNQVIKITTYKFDATGQHITDKHGNSAYIQGGLTHHRFKDFGLNVNIRSDKFLLLDTKKGDNPLFYGAVLATASARFSGDFKQPKLNVSGKSLPSTNLKLLFTEDKQLDKTNFVKFVSFKKQEESVDVVVEQSNNGLDVDMQLELTEDADIQLIFDEISGDIIKSRGRGTFNMSYTRDGEFTMNGQYVISKGEYLFTLMNLINKPFVIKPGGTITWYSDPMEALLNISAVYRGLQAPTYSLIKEELSSVGSTQDIRDAHKPSPVDLGLILTGPMLHPNISFTLDVKNLLGGNKNYVANKLNLIQSDPNELNRQVFGLLVLGNFLPPGNSLGFQETGSVGTGIFSTISELLSSQFAIYANSLLAEVVGTSKFYSGMEVDVGLNVYQTIQGTDVGDETTQARAFQFNLKNHFFNNRVTVQLGGNVDLTNQINASESDFSGDILIEIVLSKNRRYKMQVYNRFEPDDTGIHRRMKTGFGLNYQREFDSFSDLFKGMKSAVKQN